MLILSQILSEATKYIRRLQEENSEQKARIIAFETLFRSGSMGFNPTPIANHFQYAPDYNTASPPPDNTVAIIQEPESIRGPRCQVNQLRYLLPQEQYQQQRRQPFGPGSQNNGGYFGKLMVGSLAGLMIIEGFSEAEQQENSPNARGLFAIPTQALRTLSRAFHSSVGFRGLGYHVSAAQTLGYMKMALVIGTLLFVFLPTLFRSKPKSKETKTRSTSLSVMPSIGSSIQVRRQAWLTATQTVWVPHHNFFLEAVALCLEIVKLSMWNVVGSYGYAYLTSSTTQQEMARVKAWTIALDAQLAGGDIEIRKSRLILTLLASSSIPDTPARLMLKALHIRVLFWEIGNTGFNGFCMFRKAAAKVARRKWNEAKQLQRLIAHTKKKQEDELPEYLAALLEQDYDDVLADSIVERAYNLAWNLPTSSDEMGGVIGDFAIRSPLDAVAAWYAILVIQRALTRSLATLGEEETISVQKYTIDDINLATKTAPTGSEAELCALLARAVLVKEKRGTNTMSLM